MVVALPALQFIVSMTSSEAVVTEPALNQVVTGIAGKIVVSRKSFQMV